MMLVSEQLDLSPIFNRIQHDKGLLNLRQELFTVGYLFGKFRLINPADFDFLMNEFKALPQFVSQNLQDPNQKYIILSRLVCKDRLNISLLPKQIRALVDECANNKLNKKVVNFQDSNQKSEVYIKTLLEQEKLRADQEKMSEQIARKLQKEQEQLHMQRTMAKSKSASLNITCPICLQKVQLLDLALLQCQHSFHKKCIASALRVSIDQRKFPIKCPMGECKKEVNPADIQQFTPQDYLKKYQTYTLHKFVDSHSKELSWCPTPGCQYAFCYNQADSQFDCPLCKRAYCLKCRVNAHKGMTCKQFMITHRTDKNDLKFMDFVKGAKFKQCPNCHFWVEKSQGCDHMTCRCSFQFCYVCGGRYGSCKCMGTRPPRLIMD